MRSRAGKPDRLLTAEFIVLGLATMVYFVSDGMANALVPRFVVDELDGSETTAGIVMGSFAITALLCRPWLGRIADRRGARKLLIVGGIVSAASYVILLTATTVPAAILARLVLGSGKAAVFVGAAMLAIQIAPPTRRAEAASYVLVSIHVGLGIGPLVGEEILRQRTYGWVWVIIVVLSTASAAVAVRLPSRTTKTDKEPAPLISRAAIAPGIVMFLGIFTLNGFVVFAPLYGRELGLDNVGLVFATVSFTMVAVRMLFGRIPDLVGQVPASTGALLVSACAGVVIGMWISPTGMFVGAALLALGLSLLSPSLMTIATDRVPEREQGSAMATFTVFLDGANAVVGPVFGLLVSGVSYRAAFLVGAGLATIGIVVLHVVVAPKHRGRATPHAAS